MRLIIFCLFFTNIVFSQKDVFSVARNGTIEEIKEIYSKQPKQLDSINSKGFSPLILATYSNNNEVAKFIIDNSKNLNYTSNSGTAVMAATFKNNIIILNYLLTKGANPNLTDANGQTAVFLTVFTSNIEVLQLLLKYNSSTSLRDKNNKLALDYALLMGNQNIIKLLNNN